MSICINLFQSSIKFPELLLSPKTTKNKTLFALIVAMIVCFALFVSTTNVAFASTDNEAKIGTQEYATFEEALDVANNSTTPLTIELLSDVSIGLTWISTSVTIEGNNHTIFGEEQKMIRIGNNGHNVEDKIFVNINVFQNSTHNVSPFSFIYLEYVV